jgi:hypothetical protein
MSEINHKDEKRSKENDIVFSKAIKAGKRIYYIDVKQSRNEDYYVAITESKKCISNLEETQVVSFEKHKIFLYKEDFTKFVAGLQEVIGYITEKNDRTSKPDADESETVSDY